MQDKETAVFIYYCNRRYNYIIASDVTKSVICALRGYFNRDKTYSS